MSALPEDETLLQKQPGREVSVNSVKSRISFFSLVSFNIFGWTVPLQGERQSTNVTHTCCQNHLSNTELRALSEHWYLKAMLSLFICTYEGGLKRKSCTEIKALTWIHPGVVSSHLQFMFSAAIRGTCVISQVCYMYSGWNLPRCFHKVTRSLWYIENGGLNVILNLSLQMTDMWHPSRTTLQHLLTGA